MVHGIEGDIRPFDIHRGKGAGRLKPERTVLQVLLCRAKGQIVFRVRWWAANAWHRRTVNNPAAYHDLLHEILGDHCITLCYVGPEAAPIQLSARQRRLEEKIAAMAAGQLGGERSVAEF